MFDVVIIGCGVTGAATAYYLSKYDIKTAVLEAENDVAMGATKANSAVMHAGYDPKNGSLMARLNVRGSMLAKEICAKLDVPYRQVGSLVIAFDEKEDIHLRQLYENGVKNGVENLKILSGAETLDMEPNLSPYITSSLYAPSAAITSPWEYALAMTETAVKNGVNLYLKTKVEDIKKHGEKWLITTNKGDFEAKYVINAAGINAQKIHETVNPKRFETQISRGEYYLLDKSEGNTVNHIIFQCPTQKGKGVLVLPTVHGNLLVGPNADIITDSTDTANTMDGMEFIGNMARKSVPHINLKQSIRNFAGLRSNTDQNDFIIEWAQPGFMNLAGIKSPGLTAAAAIGEYAVEMLKNAGVRLTEKENFTDSRKKLRFRELTAEEKQNVIEQNPAYGRIICRCETITEGEIIDACHSVIPPCSIDGVKRRTNAGMGRCQGGFCGPRVMEILCRKLNISPLEITQDGENSIILTGYTKQGGDGNDIQSI
ncbi:MAG: NAD(P)/FAD-dependent oxidoreductase [Oscillospiraceae bacterium]|nr:NAD(P)/FAD-dependent oxidoreductase [Oscillospiraceae bacterium]